MQGDIHGANGACSSSSSSSSSSSPLQGILEHEVTFPDEMLDEGDDLLQQLSTELGIPELMAEDSGVMCDQFLAATTNNTRTANNDGFFDTFMKNEALTPDSLSLKSEPISPGSHPALPPSPTNSDHSTDSHISRSAADALSPPNSPPNALSNGAFTPAIRNLGAIQPAANQRQMQQVPSRPQLQQQQQQPIQLISTNPSPQVAVVNSGTILAVSDMGNIKLPIPKIQKKAPPPPPPAPIQQPLVLTTSQFAQLTQGGILQVNGAPAAAASLATTTTPSATSSSTPMCPLIIKTEPVTQPVMSTTTAIPTVQTVPVARPQVLKEANAASDIDLKALKRQQRMIKNRESACLSRKKKKEYVTSLEDHIKQLSKENRDLKDENANLKSRVRELESEKTLWMDSVLNSSNLKKGTALFAILFVVSLNFSSFSTLHQRHPGASLSMPFNQSPKSAVLVPDVDRSVVPSKSNHVHGFGRALLWSEDELSEKNDSSRLIPHVAQPPNVTLASPICPIYFNQTESLRLDSQLRGWFQVDPLMRGGEEGGPDAEPGKARGRFSSKRAKHDPETTSLGHYRRRPAVHSLTGGIYHMLITKPESSPTQSRDHGMSPRREENGASGQQLSVYRSNSPPRFTFESFFEAIERRDDTFYVVSFSGDHLLLPASAHNQTSRPRMSLLLPTVGVPMNDSMQAPPNHISMMQIDCEVMNTRLLHIREDAVPIHMSAQMRGSAANSSLQRNQSSNHQPNPETSGGPTNGPNATTRDSGSVETGGDFDTFARDNHVYELEPDATRNVVKRSSSSKHGAKRRDEQAKLYKRKPRTVARNRA